MNDIEAAKLARAVLRSDNLRLPVDRAAALTAMENTLRATEKPAERVFGPSGYHDTNLRSEGYSAKLSNYNEEKMFRMYVRDFYRAGGSWTETCKFFDISWDQLRRILNA
jgi:hypothetical protein